MITVVEGDLADQEVEVVVRAIRADLAPANAGSRDLVHAAGSAVEERLERIGPLPIGGAVITPGGDLLADFLIHVVVMSEDEAQTPLSVQRALRNGLRRASDWGLESLALPPLGLSVGVLEADTSARGLMEILFHHLDEGKPPLELTLVVGSAYEADLFRALVEEMSRDRNRGEEN